MRLIRVGETGRLYPRITGHRFQQETGITKSRFSESSGHKGLGYRCQKFLFCTRRCIFFLLLFETLRPPANSPPSRHNRDDANEQTVS